MIFKTILLTHCIILITGIFWLLFEIRKAIKNAKDYNEHMNQLFDDIKKYKEEKK